MSKEHHRNHCRALPLDGWTVSLGALGLLAALLVVAAACDRDDPSPSAPASAGLKEPEWFWRDRLGVRPQPLPALQRAATAGKALAALFQGDLAGLAPAVRSERIASVTAHGESAIPFLCDRLGSSRPREERMLAVAALGRIGGPHIQAPLLGMLRDEWPAVAILAADILCEVGEPWIIPRLIKAIGPYPVDYNPHLMVRVKAARALLELGNYSGIPFLIKILEENTSSERLPRAWDETTRMAWFKEDALETLSGLTGSSYGFLIDAPRQHQAAAAERFSQWWKDNCIALWRAAPFLDDPLLVAEIEEVITGLASFQIRNKDGSNYILRMLGPPVFPFLADALRSPEFFVRFHTLQIVGELAPLAGDAAELWVQAVTSCLKDRAPVIRAQTCHALGSLRHRESLSSLERLLDDPDGDVRLKAADAIGRIGGRIAESTLTSRIERLEPGQLRSEVAAALVRISVSHVEILLDELRSEDLGRQDWALQKVIDLTGDDFDFPLEGALESRQGAIKKIGEALQSLER